ncbi:unnamed protein product, partial [Didymodactylos carnosus]
IEYIQHATINKNTTRSSTSSTNSSPGIAKHRQPRSNSTSVRNELKRLITTAATLKKLSSYTNAQLTLNEINTQLANDVRLKKSSTKKSSVKKSNQKPDKNSDNEKENIDATADPDLARGEESENIEIVRSTVIRQTVKLSFGEEFLTAT